MIGGTLGISCAHAYAHTIEPFINALPGALKGIDMVVYETFRALGLKIRLCPMVIDYECDMEDESDEENYKYNIEDRDDENERRTIACVGTKHYPFKMVEVEYEQDILEAAGWDYSKEKNIQWVKKSGNELPAVAYLAVSLPLKIVHLR